MIAATVILASLDNPGIKTRGHQRRTLTPGVITIAIKTLTNIVNSVAKKNHHENVCRFGMPVIYHMCHREGHRHFANSMVDEGQARTKAAY